MILSQWWKWLTQLSVEMWNLRTKVNQMSDVVAELKTEFESYKADVDAKVSALGATIADLDAKIAAMPPAVDTTALQAVLDEVKAAHAALVPPVV